MIHEADAQAAEAVGELLAEEMITAFAVTFPDAPLGGLVDVKTGDKMEIVVQEILQDKIFLDETSNVRITEEQEPAGGPPELDLESL